MKRTRITTHDRTRIAARAIVHPRTVERVYAGEGSAYSRERCRVAAESLGLPLPPSADAESDASATGVAESAGQRIERASSA